MKRRDNARPAIFRRAVRVCSEKGFKSFLYGVLLYVCRRYAWFLNRKKLVSPGGFVIREVNGSKMYLDLADEGLSRDLIVDGVREAYALETVKRELKEGQVVVDIGANIGYYALLEARIVGTSGKVYAIEPVPGNVEILKKNIELNGYSNVEVHQLAIGGEKGLARLYVRNRRNLSSMRETSPYDEDGTVI